MTINQIQLANTFDVWRVTTNQLITIGNDLKEGNLITTGTFALGNPSGFQNNVSLNVQSGMIYGDAGLLSNVGKPSSITNQKLQNSSITVINQNQVVLSKNTIALGDTVYLNVGNLTTVNTDTSVANIASANLVNSVHVIATRADLISNAAYNRANAVNAGMIAAFALANATNIVADAACTAIISLSTGVAQINANTSAAFSAANLALSTIPGANAAVGAGANAFAAATIAGANTAVGAGANAFAAATIAGANAITGSAFARANASVNTVGSSSNTGGIGTTSIDRRILNFKDSVTILGFVTDDSARGTANVTFVANSVLPNISSQAGATFTGNLTISGTTVSDTRGGSVYDLRQASLFSPAGATSSNPSYTLSRTDAGRLLIFSCATIQLPGGNVANPFQPGDTIRLYNANTSTGSKNANVQISAAANLWTSGNVSHGANLTRNIWSNSIITITCISANVFVADGAGLLNMP